MDRQPGTMVSLALPRIIGHLPPVWLPRRKYVFLMLVAATLTALVLVEAGFSTYAKIEGSGSTRTQNRASMWTATTPMMGTMDPMTSSNITVPVQAKKTGSKKLSSTRNRKSKQSDSSLIPKGTVGNAKGKQLLEQLSPLDNVQSVIPSASLENGTLVREQSQIPEMRLLEAMQRKLLTVVSGYFEIPESPHHPVDYYRKRIKMEITWLKRYDGDKQVIFYHNLDIDNHPLNETLLDSGLTLRKVNVSELPGANFSSTLKTLCLQGPKIEQKNNKCKYLYEHLTRSESYVHVLSIWFSKLPLLGDVIRENPFNSIYFAWFDCGIRYRLGDRISKYQLSRGKVRTPKSGMRYGPSLDRKHARAVEHRMGLIAGPGHKVMKLVKLHEGKVQDILSMKLPFCYDEEIVLTELLYDPVYSKTTRALMRFFRP